MSNDQPQAARHQSDDPTLTEFLLARIADDENRARRIRPDAVDRVREYLDTGDWLHILRWDPARVLRECEAKRRIVEDLSRGRWAPYEVREFILKSLAAVYSDHPDYRDEWRP